MTFAMAWRFLRPLLPYIASALVILGLLAAYGHREYGRGKAHEVAKYQPVMDRALANIRTLKSNQAILQGALDRQNAAVVALKADGDRRAADGRKALGDAQRANAGLKDQAAALRRSGARKVDGPACPISETLKQAGSV